MFEGSRPQLTFCPRAYYLHPLQAGPLSEWPRHFARIAQLGFDHVLMPLPAQSGRSLWLIDDYDRPNFALMAAGDMSAVLARITSMAADAGLSVLIDLLLDRTARDGAYARQHADWLYTEDRDAPPDPRRPVAWQHACALRLSDPWVARSFVEDWTRRLRGWRGAGVAGFMLQSPERLPRELTATLFESVRETSDCRFIAAASGIAWDQHGVLANVGYDTVLGSSAWWEPSPLGHGDWLVEEHRRLSQIAPVMTAPEAAFGARVTHRIRQADLAPRAARRLLRLAAGTGCGWMMPMGFEFGAHDPLSATGGSPQAFADLAQNAPYDLSSEITDLNRWLSESPMLQLPARLVPLTGSGHAINAFLRTAVDVRDAEDGLLIAANVDLADDVEQQPSLLLGANAGGLSLASSDEPILWRGGELRYYPLKRPRPVIAAAITRTRRSVEAALKWPRVTIEAISPSVDGGQHTVKRVVGDVVEVEADAFMDGHDVVAVSLLWKPADESQWREVRMCALGNDRWAGEFALTRLGRHLYTVQAWRDDWASYRHEIEKKHAARLKIDVELTEGLQKIDDAAKAVLDTELAARLKVITTSLTSADAEQRFAALMSPHTADAMRAADVRPFAAIHDPALSIDAEPPTARFANWYELFPRSMSFDMDRHGTFVDVIGQLPRIRDMGFDVLYFPPIHPIGRKHRKGRNNTLTAGPDDPGSPYAIGAEEGGYEAVDPRLGTLDDFRRLRDAARENGLQLALDFAIQCAPDHPWLKDHPDWFAWRPDGTIKYAENPPKKYEDIVNVDFYADGAMPGLWLALRDAVLFWCNEGVRLFRVDNPHTKPLPFWKWMIADVRGRYPDAVFLAEAFTRPKLMRRLAKIGYSQSYTYFTWRNTKAEITEYLTELTQTEMREYFRPHFFVNTPDINPLFLQTSGRAGFLIRAALATTLSGLWGVYSGFELCEAAALPNKEEYLDSEKYQIRVWDWQRPGHITQEITLLNRLRRQHPTLQTHLGLRFMQCWNDNVLLFCKATPDRSDVLLIAVSLDPHNAQEADFEIPLWDFGLADHDALAVEDRVNGARFTWQGKIQHLRITPEQPFAVWRLSAPV